MTGRLGVLAVVLAAALVHPAGALAHATLTGASPEFRERIDQAPSQVILRFSQAIESIPAGIVVRDPRGRLVSLPARPGVDGRSLVARFGLPLRRGAYTVRWQTLSTSDGHVVSGVYTFGVGVPAPPPTEAVGASGPTRTDETVRWLSYLGLALLAGALAMRLIVLPTGTNARVDGRLLGLAGIGALLALNAGIAGFLFRAEDALQLPFERFLYADLSPFANGTRFGIAWVWMTLASALAGLLIGLSWLTRRVAFLWPALGIGVVLGSGFSLSGHSASEPNSSWLSATADMAHVAAAAIWVGGLLALALAVWPLSPEDRRRAFLRFSRLAAALVGVLLVAGIYLAALRLPAAADLWRTGYGRVLTVKVLLVALSLLWGAAHHFLVRPRLERGVVVPAGRVGRSLLGESLAGVAVLLAAAVLVNSAPPRQPASARERQPALTEASTR